MPATESKTTHTPGPWRKQSNYVMAIIRGKEVSLASCDPTDVLDGVVEAEANARMMAAAPDLLAVCRTISMCHGLRDVIGPTRWKELSAAIAKAGA